MIKYLTIIVVFIVCSILSEIYFALPSHTFNSLRFYTQRGGGEQCLKNLKTFSSDFKALGTFTENKCIVKIREYQTTKSDGRRGRKHRRNSSGDEHHVGFDFPSVLESR